MSQYSDGTVTLTNGSATVNGDVTLWAANAGATNLFVALGIAGEDVAYEIASVDDDVTIQLTAPFVGTSGGTRAYTIHKDFRPNGLPIFNRNDVAPHAIFNRWSATIETLITGAANTAEIDDLTQLTAGQLDAVLDSLIVHDASADEAKQFLIQDLPAAPPADDSIGYVKLNTDAKRPTPVQRPGNFSPSQAELDANAYQILNAGGITLDTRAVGSTLIGANVSGATLPITNGSASVSLGPAQILDAEPWMLFWDTATTVHVLTRS